MWQTAVILLVLTAVLVYVVRHYARVYRSKVPTCSCCSECCSAQVPDSPEACECHDEDNPSMCGKEPL